MKSLEWKKVKGGGNYILDNGQGKVYLSYQPNDWAHDFTELDFLRNRNLDSHNPETAIVLRGDKANGLDRFLIYRGDRREELQKLYPNIEKLKNHWKKYGGHFWSDSLEN